MIEELFKKTVALRASDLHIQAGEQPRVRIGASLQTLDLPRLSKDDTKDLVYATLDDTQRSRLADETTWCWSVNLRGHGRFRCAATRSCGAWAGAFRHIPETTTPLGELNLPNGVEAFSNAREGLVLVSGPARSGRSTTLAALVDAINRTRAVRILTVEKPIEHLHPSRKALVTQHEVRVDTPSYARALASARTLDADVVMLDRLENIETAIEAMETANAGRLVLAATHGRTVYQTLTQLLAKGERHHGREATLMLLANALVGIVSQRLLPATDGTTLVPAAAWCAVTPAIRHLIWNDQLAKLHSAMLASTGKGQSLNQSLQRLAHRALITRGTALAASDTPSDLETLLNRP